MACIWVPWLLIFAVSNLLLIIDCINLVSPSSGVHLGTCVYGFSTKEMGLLFFPVFPDFSRNSPIANDLISLSLPDQRNQHPTVMNHVIFHFVCCQDLSSLGHPPKKGWNCRYQSTMNSHYQTSSYPNDQPSFNRFFYDRSRQDNLSLVHRKRILKS